MCRAAFSMGLLLLWSAVAMAASVDMADTEMVFVDARGDTGYYVDMKSLDFQGENEVTARVEIVCADKDRLYLYRIRFWSLSWRCTPRRSISAAMPCRPW